MITRLPRSQLGARAAAALALPTLLACALGLGGGAPVLAGKIPSVGPVRGVRPGDLARDFRLEDLDGRLYSLKEALERNRVVQVVFWATWCFPCIEEVPRLLAAYAKYRDRGYEILGVVVTREQTRRGVRSFVEEHEITYPILWDGKGVAVERYRVASLPQNFLIGADGIIRHAGNALPDDYHALIERLTTGDAAAGTSRK
ncbi:MAG: TlpA disulfide reductase family protein [Acidobacteriota bacterium]